MSPEIDLVALQHRRELEARDHSKLAAILRDEKARKAERPSLVEKITIRRSFNEVSEAIAGYALTTPYRGSNPETSTFAKNNINRVDVASLAAASIRCVWTLDRAMTGKPLTALGFMLALGKYFRSILDADEAIRSEPNEAEMSAAIKKHKYTSDWTKKTLVRHGTILLSSLLSAGLVELDNLAGIDGQITKVVIMSEKSQKIMEELYGSPDLMGLLLIARPVMVCPPLPWVDAGKGAYVTDMMRQHTDLVRIPHGGQKDFLPFQALAGSPALRAVNTLQSVPLRINADAMELRRFVWDCDISITGHTPLRHKLALPEIPEDIDGWPSAKKRTFWSDYSRRKRMNKVVFANTVPWVRGTVAATELLTLGVPFYLPHNLDTRGRVYPIPHFSHHAQDSQSALFEFHTGRPLGAIGLFWLKVHVANSGDFGKISKDNLKARAGWCDDNREALEHMADNWKEDRLWSEADAPFSFFAAVKDLVRAWRSPDPEAYVSHIPVAVDGTNSGVQHYSALMRAEEGKYVGLVPTDGAVDLYAVVAAECTKSIEANNTLAGKSRKELVAALSEHMEVIRDIRKEMSEHKENGDKELAKALQPALDEEQLAVDACSRALWGIEKITRSTVKRPVMTYGYSASTYGISQQIAEDYMQPLDIAVLRGEIAENPFGTEWRAPAMLLGKEIYRSTQAILPRVTDAMKWLRAVAGLLGKEGLPVKFMTPSGFPCVFKKSQRKSISLRVKLLGLPDTDTISVRMNVPHPKDLNIAEMRNSVAPNTIHACDGSHLALAVNKAANQGVTDLLCVHDSFAAHAGNVGLLVDSLRSSFVEQYESWNPLEDIYEYAKEVLPEDTEIPPVPEQGTLDLQGVLQSDYLFS